MTLSGCGEKNGSFGGSSNVKGFDLELWRPNCFFGWLRLGSPPRQMFQAFLLIHKEFPGFHVQRVQDLFFSLTQNELQDTPKVAAIFSKIRNDWNDHFSEIIFVHLCVGIFSVPTSMALPGATRTVGNEVILHRLLLPEFRWATSLKCSLYPIVSNCARGVGWSR